MTAAVRGPYRTGASAPRGAARLVRCPQPHCRSISWCSVTSARAAGRLDGSWSTSAGVVDAIATRVASSKTATALRAE